MALGDQLVDLMKRLGPAGVLGVLWAVIPAVAGITLLVHIETVSAWLQARGEIGLTIYIAAFVLCAGLGLLPTYAQALLGGWVFGLIAGLPAALLGFVGAAVVGYFIARTVSQDRVENIIRKNDKARIIRESLIGHGFAKTLFVVTLVRIPPNSPFAITNLVMASAKVPIVPFVIGTAVGMAPRTAVAVAVAAAGADAFSEGGGAGLYTLARERLGTFGLIISVVLMLIVLWIIIAMANKALERVQRGAQERMPIDERENDIKPS